MNDLAPVFPGGARGGAGMPKSDGVLRQDEVSRVKETLMRMGYPNVYDERTALDSRTVARGVPVRLVCGAHTMTWDEAKRLAGVMDDHAVLGTT